jgi:uncharacterized protein YajQ (UPF0234 family)
MKASNKKLVPKHIRNKHAKEIRKLLKNKKMKVSAKIIYYF